MVFSFTEIDWFSLKLLCMIASCNNGWISHKKKIRTFPFFHTNIKKKKAIILHKIKYSLFFALFIIIFLI